MSHEKKAAAVSDSGFVRVGSHVINVAHVMTVEGGKLKLADGSILLLSGDDAAELLCAIGCDAEPKAAKPVKGE